MAKKLDNSVNSLGGTFINPSMPQDFIGSTYNNDVKAGVSKFHLSTLENDGSVLVLTGLLTELPEFSFTVNYEDGPGNEWQDTIGNFTGNGLIELINSLGSANLGEDGETKFRNLIKASTWTKKVYNGYSISNIPLKFRIYTSDTLGQTSADTWLYNLAKYAAVSYENIMTPSLLVSNALNAYANVTNSGERAAMSEHLAKLVNPSGNRSANDEAIENAEAYDRDLKRNEHAIAAFNKAIHNYIGDRFKIVWKNGTSSIKSTLVNLVTNTKGYNDRTIHLYYAVANSESDKSLASAHVGHVMESGINKASYNHDSQKPFDLSDIQRAFENLNPNENELSPDDISIWKRVKVAVLNELDRVNTSSDFNESETFKKNIKLIKEMADAAGDFLVEKFNEYRVVNPFNKNNSLGEKLWYLHLYENVVFKKEQPLIVYISDWSYQRSEEYELNTKQPVYFEFTINCVLDQVYSRDIWNKMLYTP